MIVNCTYNDFAIVVLFAITFFHRVTCNRIHTISYSEKDEPLLICYISRLLTGVLRQYNRFYLFLMCLLQSVPCFLCVSSICVLLLSIIIIDHNHHQCVLLVL